MINAMRTLALDYLFDKLGEKDNPPQNLEEWYYKLRTDHPERLFSSLVEDVSDIEKIYILNPDKTDSSMVNMDVEDMTKGKASKLPFKQYRARSIGPVIKRSKTKNKVSPELTTQEATLKYFKMVSDSSTPWAGYFGEISKILDRPKLKLTDNSIIETGKDKEWQTIYSAAIEFIPSTKGTVIVTVADMENKWPGERREYKEYLMNELSTIKYCTKDAPSEDNQTCPLCKSSNITVFPNALKGAGINLTNIDREGAFTGINTAWAWKRYALCNACANLLYIYKFHFLKRDDKKRNPFITPIAGDNALVIPFTTVDYQTRQNILRKVKDFVKSTSSDVEEEEITLLDILKDEKGILNLTFLWANVGQEIDDVTGMITNVPPSRLAQLSRSNEESRDWKHPLFPNTFLRIKQNNFTPDLSLRALRVLFRVGGKKTEQLKKAIADSVYHKAGIPTTRFWEEIMTTARWYWLEAIKNGSAYGLLNEGKKKTGEPYLTAAGWLRHLCWWLYYFKRLEVMKMEGNFYEPQMERLKPYFGLESGVNSPQKAYAFLLGVLYGKVLQVQGARGVNVGANALTWLKRLTLKGRDLPNLYIKTREKLLAYETEKSEDVRELITEIGNLGWRLGDNIELDEIPTNYYLLLGQSLTTTIL
jgi:CRISPR-associated protein Csh1